MGKYKTIEFEYDDKQVVARVYVGTTLARGPDHDDVISINVQGIQYPDRALEARLKELSIIKAREEV